MAKITISPKKQGRSARGHQVRLSEAAHQRLTALSRDSGRAMNEIVEMALSQVRVAREHGRR
jgi:predicted DNA-binding protein